MDDGKALRTVTFGKYGQCKAQEPFSVWAKDWLEKYKMAESTRKFHAGQRPVWSLVGAVSDNLRDIGAKHLFAGSSRLSSSTVRSWPLARPIDDYHA